VGAKIVYSFANDLHPKDLEALTLSLTLLEEDSLLFFHNILREQYLKCMVPRGGPHTRRMIQARTMLPWTLLSYAHVRMSTFM
jgi:hypothetical protein